MTKSLFGPKAARKWVEREFKRGLPVYLFEVADFFRGDAAFLKARLVMSGMEIAKLAVRSKGQPVGESPRWERGPNLY